MAAVSNPGDIPMPTGPTAARLVTPFWTSASETALAAEAAALEAKAAGYERYAQAVMGERQRSPELLQGHAGDARVALLDRMATHAAGAADYFTSAAAAVHEWESAVRGLKLILTSIADASEPEYQRALKSKLGVVAAEGVIEAFLPESAQAEVEALAAIAAAPAPGPPPASPLSASDDNPAPGTTTTEPTIQLVDHTVGNPAGAASPEIGSTGDQRFSAGDGVASTTAEPVDATLVAGDSIHDGVVDAVAPATGDERFSAADPVDGVTTTAPEMTPMTPVSGLQSAASSPASSASNAASSLKPPGNPASALSNNPLSALSGNPLSQAVDSASTGLTTPGETAPAQALTSPLGNAAESFKGAAASGFGNPGALSPRPPVENLVAPVSSQPAAAVTSTPIVAGHGPGGIGPGGGVSGGPSAGGVGGAPLAPFVPPGGGAHTAPPPAGTAPAAAPPPPAPPGGQQQAGAAPLVASGSGTGVATGMAAEDERNPDLATARRVLDGLVRGTAETSPQILMHWAVAVVHSAMGSQVVIASDAGNGGYLPGTVFVPVGVKVAALDPALPIGWAAAFTGWASPVDIVVAHAERIGERLPMVAISAIVTTYPFTPRPPGVRDLEVVQFADVLLKPGSAPVLDNAHQHRLVCAHPDLAQRIAMLNRGPEWNAMLASQISAAVIMAAQDEALGGGDTLVDPYDVDTLRAIGGNQAVDWDAYVEHAMRRDNHPLFPPTTRPLDLDDSQVAVTSRAIYRRLFRMARLVELVRCWQDRPVSVLDIVYCGLTGGFGPAVDAVVSEWERRLNGPFNPNETK